MPPVPVPVPVSARLDCLMLFGRVQYSSFALRDTHIRLDSQDCETYISHLLHLIGKFIRDERIREMQRTFFRSVVVGHHIRGQNSTAQTEETEFYNSLLIGAQYRSDTTVNGLRTV